MRKARRSMTMAGVTLLLATTAGAQGAKPLKKCAADAVIAGTVCMDKYEASVWAVPNAATTNAGLVRKIQQGKVTLADLTTGGATQVSASSGSGCTPAFPATFPTNGQWTVPLYAVSIPGVHPTGCLSWLQAQQACGNSRKRLPSNGEWQLAVAGTPDPGPDDGSTDCHTGSTADATDAGSRSACVSSSGAFDMVGNLWEWVADWMPRSTTCGGSWSGSSDSQCLAGADTTGEPGVLVRGGDYASSSAAGPLAVVGLNPPLSYAHFLVGFRCAR